MNQLKTDPGSQKTVEEQLDEALADSFPASDPVSFITSQTEDYWKDEPADRASQPADVGGSKPKAP